MTNTFLDHATDPGQYDSGEVYWTKEGSKQHFTRRMIYEALAPRLGEVAGKRVLDIGCGQGWLCEKLAEAGAHTIGIDPSKRSIELARQNIPELDFRNESLQDFASQYKFDLITATMVFEHLGDLQETFTTIKSLLTKDGQLWVLSGDFERFTTPRFGYTVDANEITEGETVTRTDYGERAGVIYDIFRTPERFKTEASRAGLTTVLHVPVNVPDWMIEEQPQYKAFEGKPIFQIFGFEVAK